MEFNPGDVVMLKSGGVAMTVVEIAEAGIECVWIGEEGEFFREVLPPVALERLEEIGDEEEDDEEEEDEEDDDEDEDEDEEEEEEEEKPASASKRKSN